MLRYLGRRLLLLVLTLAVASALVFLITDVLPGDVGRMILGPFAPQSAVETLNRQLGADRPLPLRYGGWLGRALAGEWGGSYGFQAAVLPLVLERLGRSAVLAGTGLAVLTPI